ncbi:thioredoxin family protein [Jeotgalibacillus proteolyticus]|uniref:Thiol reductase thioredoxin n=1 Tax=Jeotgalibacillus proteolyticus TaxID=2082395 RepID=A0A2S5G8I6_9BACL|nr:thioredoxin family protein [Jeotgalibacillus proteolyticus]PPA69312.1 thiol reductase thioredoxin [Jeotgalibacillus proteolyticus]
MRKFEMIHSINEADQFIQSHSLVLLYILRTNCSVCHALLPKIQQVMNRFPAVACGQINADEVEEVAKHLTIFTVPVLLLFGEGKELLREARFVRVDEFEEQVLKISSAFEE